MVCAVEEIEKSTLFLGEGGENVTKTLKNRILLPSVSTLLSPIVALSSRNIPVYITSDDIVRQTAYFQLTLINFSFSHRNITSSYGVKDFCFIFFQMIKDMKKQFSGLLYEIGFLDSTNPRAISANYNSGIFV